MAKKSRKSSSNDEIHDERFAAAATRPQFHKAKRSGSYNANNTNNTKNKDNENLNNDDGKSNNNDNDAPSSGVLQSSGLGVSLTQAIQSDDRFSAALLNSDKFGCVPSRDKYGRKTKKKKDRKQKDENEHEEKSGEEESSEETEEIMNDENAKESKKVSKKKAEEDDVEQDNSMEARIAYLNALSRGDLSASSSSESSNGESDDDSDDDDDSTSEEDNVYGKSGIFDPAHKSLPGTHIQPSDDEEEINLTDDPSPYLCILNLNWEHTRAVDVYAMLHSFCPPGTLKGVEVYPSDFGKERMEKERVEGPTGLWKRGEKADDEDESANIEDGSESESKDNDNDSNNESEHDSDTDDSQSDEELTLSEATSKLYSHFPPQSTITKNSQLRTPEEEEEGFDPEKLREYEVSKLRYYFCVATFHSSEAASGAYENVDGMEMEASAAEIDVRVLPVDRYASTIEGRTMRDACDTLPAKYAPPEDNVTVALRQSRVSCSWERGDADRERKLTRYGMGKDAWEAMAEGDDIKFYLATSDNSSSEEDESDEEEKSVKEVKEKKKQGEKKGSGMRAMLGLAGSDSEDNDNDNQHLEDQSISEDSSSGSDSNDSKENDSEINHKKHSKLLSSTESESESDQEEEEAADDNKQVTFTPGKRNLEKKIRSKLQSKQTDAVDGKTNNGNNDFEKYLEKQKAKRRERRQAARSKKNDPKNDDDDDDDDDGMYGDDPEFGRVQFSDEESTTEENNKGDAGAAGDSDGGDDGFFLGEAASKSKSSKNKKKKQRMVEETSI
eukprot:CAMPEP_0172304524 /NCGR_PEP_ID=MMETSP1058-20130122/5915_1 /TAXON_ID=83371 /ORGANISM="Detonula confervacea, Strain CCMP 353" /LENGTH=782 /DNA_ID=CAMNT_0013015781 /DNA_START=11 /DNA_END=2356 /DNA_ORIENTATION=+